MVVYLIECIPTGKKYIGKTVQTSRERWREHRTEARIGRKHTPLLQAIREHGPDAFRVTDLCTVDSQAKLDRKERRYIAEYGTDDPTKGYNRIGGGGGSRKLKRYDARAPLPEETKHKIRLSLLAYYSQRKGAIACHQLPA